jgi:hypothetical protein
MGRTWSWSTSNGTLRVGESPASPRCRSWWTRGLRRVEADQFRLLTPIDELTLYQWHTRTAEDYFCPSCGVLPFRRPRHRTSREIAEGMPEFTGWSVNVRCLEGVDLSAVPVRQVFGSRLD